MGGADLEKLGVEAYQLREYPRALRLLREAVAAEKPRPSAWLWLSRTQLAMDDANAALASILAYLDLDPVAPRGILHLVAVLRKQGEREQAVRLLTVLAQRHLDEPEVLRPIVTRLLGFDAFAEAADVAQRLHTLQPGDLDATTALATALGHTGRLAEAEAMIEEALGRAPERAALAKSQMALHLGMAEAAWAALAPVADTQAGARHVIATAQLLLQQGHGTLALAAAARAERAAPDEPEIGEKSERLRGEVQILSGGWAAPAWKAAPGRATPGLVLHVVGASAPHRQTGYTVRTRSIVQAQRAAGLRPEVVTPLGFPWTDGVNEAVVREEVGGIPHHRLTPFDAAPSLRYHRRTVLSALPLRPDDRLTENARRLAILARELQPAVLHAASDFRNALLALATGDVLGIPVVYEVRGFPWETWLSRDSRHTPDAETYHWQQARDTECALRADHVVTLAEVMRGALIERGISRDKITVIPNAVDVEVFRPVRRDAALAASFGIGPEETVLGYISGIERHEGIEYLIAATARLIAAGRRVKTLIVGQGTDKSRLEAYAADLGLAGSVVFAGQAPHAEILRFYGLIDIFVVPRTTDRVCMLVTPLKPYEAMATERAVVVAATPALLEMVVPGETGLTFTSEDPAHLAAVIESLLNDPDRRTALGRTARRWVCRHRTWAENGQRYRNLYEALGVPMQCEQQDAAQMANLLR